MKKLIPLVALTLTACAQTHDVTLTPHHGGAIAHGTAESTGTGQGPITLTANGTTYSGHWTVSETGRTETTAYGSISAHSLSTGHINARGRSRAMTSTGQLRGNATLSAPTGQTMTCRFTYAEQTGTGTGTCQDSQSRTYEMQVR